MDWSAALSALGHVLGSAALVGAPGATPPSLSQSRPEDFYYEAPSQRAVTNAAIARAENGKTSCVAQVGPDRWSVRSCAAPVEQPVVLLTAR